MGGESVGAAEVGPTGLVGDREWAVYGVDGKLASGKHTKRFRRMDPVFALRAARCDDGVVVVVMPDGAEVPAGLAGTDALLCTHFGEVVTLRRETDVVHQDAAGFSLVGTATLAELGRHEGDGRPVDPRHLRANVVVKTALPYVEESWIGHEVTIGGIRVRITEAIERCRMVGVAQVGLAGRPGMLRAIGDHHDLIAGVYAEVVAPGLLTVGDMAQPEL